MKPKPKLPPPPSPSELEQMIEDAAAKAAATELPACVPRLTEREIRLAVMAAATWLRDPQETGAPWWPSGNLDIHGLSPGGDVGQHIVTIGWMNPYGRFRTPTICSVLCRPVCREERVGLPPCAVVSWRVLPIGKTRMDPQESPWGIIPPEPTVVQGVLL